jgi:hypothetical protein
MRSVAVATLAFLSLAVARASASPNEPGLQSDPTIWKSGPASEPAKGNEDDAWQQFAYASARERLEKSKRHMGVLLARIAVVQALLETRQPSPPEKLIELVGEAEAKRLMAQTSQVADAEQKKLDLEQIAAASSVEGLQRQRKGLQESVANADATARESSEHMRTLTDASKGGFATNTSIDLAHNNLTQSFMNLQALTAALALVEQNLSKATEEKELIAITARVEEEKELAADLASLDEEEATQMTLGELFSRSLPRSCRQVTGAPP